VKRGPGWVTPLGNLKPNATGLGRLFFHLERSLPPPPPPLLRPFRAQRRVLRADGTGIRGIVALRNTCVEKSPLGLAPAFWDLDQGAFLLALFHNKIPPVKARW
jgi:hypothetical protein